jgi:hypothetical protein
MKTIILSFFLLPFSFLFSQGNLQFNQVFNYSLSGTFNANLTNSSAAFTMQTINVTVPINKVWKIESTSCRASISTHVNSPYHTPYLLLNNNLISSTDSEVTLNSVCPIWLPSGNYVIQLLIQTSGNYAAGNAYGMISAIEFNIIP